MESDEGDGGSCLEGMVSCLMPSSGEFLRPFSSRLRKSDEMTKFRYFGYFREIGWFGRCLYRSESEDSH